MLTENNDFYDFEDTVDSFVPDDPERKNNVGNGKKGKRAFSRWFSDVETEEPVNQVASDTIPKDTAFSWGNWKKQKFSGSGPRNYSKDVIQWDGTDSEDNFMARKDMRENYSTTDKAFDDIAGNYYNSVLVSNFKRNRNATKKKAKDVYMSYISVVGADPQLATREMMRADNPVKDFEKAMGSINVDELKRLAKPYADYAGYNTDEYVKKFIIPTMRKRLADELLKENLPKSKAEYILRSAINNSLVGKVGTIGMNMSLGDDMHTSLSLEGLNNYNASRLDKFAGNVGGLLLDIPVFGFLGNASSRLVGRLTSKVVENVAKKVLTMKGGETMTLESAKVLTKRAIIGKLKNRMAQSAAVQGLTLGTYDVANSIADDLLAGGSVDAGKAMRSFGKGAATGAVLGFVGTPLREMAKRQKGFNKVAASVGVLGVESAVFTGITEAEKLANDIEVTPVDFMLDYGESVATLGVMKMAHWRPKGAAVKLDRLGELKSELKLSSSERDELNEMNVDPERFMYLIQRALKLPAFGGKGFDDVLDTYSRIMANREVSASTKSKLMFLIENKVSSTPPLPMDYSAGRGEDGKWFVTYYDGVGQKVATEKFNNAGNANSRMMVQSGKLRKNRVLLFETELTQGAQSHNLLRQAGILAGKSNVDLNLLAEAMYKKVTGEELSPKESKLVDVVLEMASYDEAGMVQYLYDVRRRIESKHGLEKGTLTKYLDNDFYRNKENENAALDEYEAILRSEVNRLKGGTDKNRSRRMIKQGLNSEYLGMSNDEVKKKEIADHEAWVEIRDADRIGLRQKPHAPRQSLERQIVIPEDDNSGIVWSANDVKNTKSDISLYEKRALELGEKLGVRLNLITDEHQVELPQSSHPEEIMRYNTNVRAEGWMHMGKIYINLPNIKSVEHAERVVLHESVAHRGLLSVFGDNLYEFLEDVYRKASPEVLKGIKEIKKRYSFADNYTVVEEYLAHLAEKVNPAPQERSLLVRVKNYIRNLLIKMKLYTGSNRTVSEKELTDIMQRHCEYMMMHRKPADYRKDVFGSFKAAHAKEDTYYNYNNYLDGLVKRAESGELFSQTPRFFRNTKGALYYEHLPEKFKERVRSWFGKDDGKVDVTDDAERYRLSEEYDLPEPGFEESGEEGMSVNPKPGDIKFRDPFYRILMLKSPSDAVEYRELMETPISRWTENDIQEWNRLSDVARNANVNLVLGDVVKSSDLYKEHPSLYSVPLVIGDNLSAPVEFDSANNRFVVDKSVFTSSQRKELFASPIADAANHYALAEAAVNDNVDRVNERLSVKYDDAMTLARKIRSAQETIPGYDAEGSIRNRFKQTYGFMPDEFIQRFPEPDDYFLYRLSKGLSRNVKQNAAEPGSHENMGNIRRFFVGPLEVIMEAGKGTDNKGGLLRVKNRAEQYYNMKKSDLEQAETGGLTDDYLEW